jgi:hypothetical protein
MQNRLHAITLNALHLEPERVYNIAEETHVGSPSFAHCLLDCLSRHAVKANAFTVIVDGLDYKFLRTLLI